MSKADVLFKEMCEDIIANGFSSEGQDVRAKWEDGTPAHTIKKFGVVNRYNLQEEFPALTLRPTALKSAFDELLWIWQKKSNNVNDLNSHIWDQWANEEGSIGKAYGYQIGKRYHHHMINDDERMTFDLAAFIKEYPSAALAAKVNTNWKNLKITQWVRMDQIDGILYDLKHNPNSRRILTNIYNFADLNEMNLYPCAYSMTFNVKDGKLNGILNQRSNDMLVANNWNVCQYAILIHMFAQVSGLQVGELVHVISDAHLYDRHIPILEKVMQNPQYDAPVLKINPEVKNFYDFKVEDFELVDYKSTPLDTKLEVAV